MSKCLKCGAQLPPQGECQVCHGKGLPRGAPPVPPRIPSVAPPAPRPPPPAAAPPVPRAQIAAPVIPRPPSIQRPPSMPQAPVARQSAIPAQAPPAPHASPALSAAPSPSDIVELHAEPASWWRRILAFTIDTALVLAVLSLYMLAATAIAGTPKAETHLTGIDAWMARAHAMEKVLVPGVILACLLAVLYSSVAGFAGGRTIGRRLLGIRLVDSSGLAPVPARAVVRALLSVFSFCFFFGGFWFALFDRKGQTLHDKLTSTFIVRPT